MTDTDQQITPADATIVSTGTGTKGPEERELPESLSNDMSLCLRILRDVLGEYDPQLLATQRPESLAEQTYTTEQAERQYQATLRHQECNYNVTSEKLNIAKGEWALKQSKAAQSAQQAAANAGAKSAGSSGGSGSGSVLSSGGSTIVPYSAARLYRQGRSDTAIRSELLKEGYSNDEVANILKQLGS